jgi:uroporphyrinogen-III decarboxylase
MTSDLVRCQGGDGVPTNELLAGRESLIAAAIDLELPDRIPIVYQGEAFSPRYVGVSLATYATDPDAAVAATLAALERLEGFDAISTVPGGRIGVLLASIWMTHVSIPGRELPAESLWQAAERDEMKVADYEAILADGWTAFEAAFRPRVLDVAELAETDRWLEAGFDAVVVSFRERGFVPLSGAIVATPFERLCGARSMPEFFKDLHRRPKLVAQVMDAMLPTIVEEALAVAQACSLPSIWIGGWRSASGMLTRSMWEDFVFPHLKTLVTALVDAGIKPTLHFDQDWTRDLPRLRELPARGCILNLDGTTDIRRAKEVLGDHMAIMGDVPATLLATGSPADVRVYVRRLIADVGPRGFLLAPGCDIPVNARPENVEALVAAGLEYGS